MSHRACSDLDGPGRSSAWRARGSPTVTASECGSEAGLIAFAASNGWPASACGVDQLERFNHSGYGSIWVWLGCNGNYAPGCPAGPTVSAHDLPPLRSTEPADLGQPARLNAGRRGDPRAPEHRGRCRRQRRWPQLDRRLRQQPAGGPGKALPLRGHPDRQRERQRHRRSITDPCPGEGKAEWTLDTEEYPFHNGTNSVSVCAADFSTIGDPNTTCESRSVSVDNTCTPSLVDGGEALSADFGSGGDSLVVPYGRGAVLGGRLSDAGGDPVPGATLCVKMQTLGTSATPSVCGDGADRRRRPLPLQGECGARPRTNDRLPPRCQADRERGRLLLPRPPTLRLIHRGSQTANESRCGGTCPDRTPGVASSSCRQALLDQITGSPSAARRATEAGASAPATASMTPRRGPPTGFVP